MLQLRDLDTHRVLPGITLGDIGPKMGFHSNDNGYMILDGVRIPYDHMLMRNSKLSLSGVYSPPKHSKSNYGPMVEVRSAMVFDQASNLAKAVTIAVRYSAVRRQGFKADGKSEHQLLDYTTQQYRLFPQLASAYAYRCAGVYGRELYADTMAQMDKGRGEDLLRDLHGISSGLKACVTWDVARGIEQCRMACGGHGYAHSSGLPQIYQFTVAGCTYEGDNIVMLLQAAKYLHKVFEAVRVGDKSMTQSPVTAYLATLNQARDRTYKLHLDESLHPDQLIAAFEHASKVALVNAMTLLHAHLQSNDDKASAWDKSGVALCTAAKAHVRAHVLRCFWSNVQQLSDVKVRNALTTLVQLFAVSRMAAKGGHLASVTTEKQQKLLQNALPRLLASIRNDAVALVDAFEFPDMELQSCHGRYDGNVYESLMEWTKYETLNQQEVDTGINEHLLPYMKAARAKM